MIDPKTIACTAGHMVGGLLVPASGDRTKALLNAFERRGGYLELLSEVTQYAPYACALFAAGYSVIGDYPGVGDYEVSEPFGTWMADFILSSGYAPTARTAQEELRRLVFTFFEDAAVPEQRETLSSAIDGVQP